jgi:hypothetical protein
VLNIVLGLYLTRQSLVKQLDRIFKIFQDEQVSC